VDGRNCYSSSPGRSETRPPVRLQSKRRPTMGEEKLSAKRSKRCAGLCLLPHRQGHCGSPTTLFQTARTGRREHLGVRGLIMAPVCWDNKHSDTFLSFQRTKPERVEKKLEATARRTRSELTAKETQEEGALFHPRTTSLRLSGRRNRLS